MKEKIYKFISYKEALNFMGDWAAQNNMSYEDDEYNAIKDLMKNAKKEPKDQFLGDFGVFRVYQEPTDDYFYIGKDKIQYLYEFVVKRDA